MPQCFLWYVFHKVPIYASMSSILNEEHFNEEKQQKKGSLRARQSEVGTYPSLKSFSFHGVTALCSL